MLSDQPDALGITVKVKDQPPFSFAHLTFTIRSRTSWYVAEEHPCSLNRVLREQFLWILQQGQWADKQPVTFAFGISTKSG